MQYVGMIDISVGIIFLSTSPVHFGTDPVDFGTGPVDFETGPVDFGLASYVGLTQACPTSKLEDSIMSLHQLPYHHCPV